MSWLLLAVQIALAAVLILAATGKLLRAEEFVAALRLSHLPDALVAPVAVVVPILELGLGLALLLAPDGALPVAFGGTAALLACFTLWMGWVRAKGLRVHCGCFGTGDREIGVRSLGRNALLLGIALIGLLLAARVEAPPSGPSLAMAVTVTALGLCLALGQALRAAWPHLALTFDRLEAREAGAPGNE